MTRAFFLIALFLVRPVWTTAQADNAAPASTIKELEAQHGKKPKLIKPVQPVYPYAMSRAGLIGAVSISFIIDREGNVQNPYVVKSNNPWFERPATDAIMQWKFQPGEMNGRRVNVRAVQKIEFNLNTGGSTPQLWRVSKSKNHGKLPEELRWDTPPHPVASLFPVYPFEQLKGGVGGKVRISYVVGPGGQVVMAKIQETSSPELGSAVLAMIDAWRFSPPKKKDGTPCHAALESEYDFQADGRGDVPVSDEAWRILRDLGKNPAVIASAADLDQPLKPLSRRPPVYPTALVKESETGQTVIEFYIDRNGDAQLPRIVSSTAPEFGYAAVQAVATWRFESPKRNRKPVAVHVRVPLEFNLDKRSGSAPPER